MTPPQTPEELVAAILKESANIPADRCVRIHAHATRLKALLAERDAPQPCGTCQGKGYVPVRVPVTGEMEADAGMEPGSGGYVTEGEPCMDCNRSGEALSPKNDAAAGDATALLEAIIAYYDGNEVSANMIRERWLPQARTVVASARSGVPRPDVLGAAKPAEREHLPAAPCVFCGSYTNQHYRTVGIALDDCTAMCDTCADTLAAARGGAA